MSASAPYDTKRYTARNFSQVPVYNTAATTIYAGTLVMLTALGYAMPAAPAASVVFLGVAADTVECAASADELINLEQGVFTFENSATNPLGATHIGRPAFCEDDMTVANKAGTNGFAVGVFLGLDADGKCIVDTQRASPVTALDAPVVLTAARTLTAEDHGKTFILALAAGFTVTLPANTVAGFKATFRVGVAPTGDYVIAAATADTMAGHVLSSSGAAEDTEAAFTGDQLNFISAAGAAKVGDWAEFYIDGVYGVHARGECATAGGITITG